MERQKQEQAWSQFCMTGRIEDYMSYKNSMQEQKERSKDTDGRVSSSDGDGSGNHAYIGL